MWWRRAGIWSQPVYLPVSTRPNIVTQKSIMIMNDPLTSLSFHVNLPFHPWDKVVSTSYLANARSSLQMQGQAHRWGQGSGLHIWHGIRPIHFLFVSRQSDQTFLRYGQCSNTAIKSCDNLISGSYIIGQTSIYLFIGATAMTLSQGYGEVI